MNVYFTRAGSYVDKPGYLQSAQGGRDSLTVQVVLNVHFMRAG